MMFEIGQIFKDGYPPEAAIWCNGNRCVLKRTEEKGGINYVIVKDEEPVCVKISRLKEQLSGSDYMIIKCYESFLTGSVIPYDYKSIISRRQSIRDEINKLQVCT